MKAHHIKAIKDILAEYGEKGESGESSSEQKNELENGTEIDGEVPDFMDTLKPEVEEYPTGEKAGIAGAKQFGGAKAKGPDISPHANSKGSKGTRLKLLAGLLKKKMGK